MSLTFTLAHCLTPLSRPPVVVDVSVAGRQSWWMTDDDSLLPVTHARAILSSSILVRSGRSSGSSSRPNLAWPPANTIINSHKTLTTNNYHYCTHLTAYFQWVSRTRDITSLDLNEAGDGGVLGCSGISSVYMQTICTSLRTNNHTNTSSLNFYRLDALNDAQPPASMHWRAAALII